MKNVQKSYNNLYKAPSCVESCLKWMFISVEYFCILLLSSKNQQLGVIKRVLEKISESVAEERIKKKYPFTSQMSFEPTHIK